RRSEISDGINTRSVLNQILNVPVALTAGEVLGISKKLSGLLAELIKPRTVVKRGINQTGSQLNIISERMYEKIIKLPIK
ncbi:hypothetical protein P692DRAFT_20666841, partial [Suillus brevipes Sb2]